MEDEFDILAAKVLGGEASVEDELRLEALLAQSAERRQKYAGLKAAWMSLEATALIVRAVEAHPEPIPARHLRQLQQVVREKVHGRNTVTTPRQRSLATVAPEASTGIFSVFWRWLRIRTGFSPSAASVALLATGVITAVVLRSLRPGDSLSPEITLSVPVGYLIGQEGSIELLRVGMPVPVEVAVAMHGPDELRLAPGAQATLLTRTGMVAVAGALRSPVSNLVPVAGVSGVDAATRRLNSALFLPTTELLAAGLLVSTRASGSIPLYSPIGATANRTPLLLWRSEPGKTYDLAISDEFDSRTSPWRIAGVVPPVDFSKVETWKGRTLAGNGLYRLRVSETGRPLMASEYTFRTDDNSVALSRADASNPLLDAVQILNTAPARVGDALALLLRLPPDQADTELALRLKLLLFGQLGYQADFETTLAQLQATP